MTKPDLLHKLEEVILHCLITFAEVCAGFWMITSEVLRFLVSSSSLCLLWLKHKNWAVVKQMEDVLIPCDLCHNKACFMLHALSVYGLFNHPSDRFIFTGTVVTQLRRLVSFLLILSSCRLYP